MSNNLIESLYLHFPYCRHLCNYCDFFKNKIDPKDYSYSSFEDSLIQSFAKHDKLLDDYGFQFSPLKSLYVGGGTPSLWGRDGAKFLQEILKQKQISFHSDIEFTMEVNPGSWNLECINAWENIGVNRFSVGLQSINPEFIKLLDRVHNLEDAYKTAKFFNQKKVSFSVDFMIGLPYSKEKKRDIKSELSEILSFGPSHISLYILTVPKQYIHYKYLPDEDFIRDEYLLVSEFLQSQGFLHYEVSNYAKKGFESFHNLQYWKSKSVAALGPSATGLLLKDRDLGYRYKWKTTDTSYQVEELDKEALWLERLYMALRTNQGILIDDFFTKDQRHLINRLVGKWALEGLISENCEEVLRPTAKGFVVLDSLIDEIFSVISVR